MHSPFSQSFTHSLHVAGDRRTPRPRSTTARGCMDGVGRRLHQAAARQAGTPGERRLARATPTRAVDQPLPGRGISLAPSPLHANHAKRPAGPVRPRHTCEGPTESNGNMGRVRCNSDVEPGAGGDSTAPCPSDRGTPAGGMARKRRSHPVPATPLVALVRFVLCVSDEKIGRIS